LTSRLPSIILYISIFISNYPNIEYRTYIYIIYIGFISLLAQFSWLLGIKWAYQLIVPFNNIFVTGDQQFTKLRKTTYA
jgi:hypothetical protein